MELEQREAALVLGHREAERELESERQRYQPVEEDSAGAVAGLRGCRVNRIVGCHKPSRDCPALPLGQREPPCELVSATWPGPAGYSSGGGPNGSSGSNSRSRSTLAPPSSAVSRLFSSHTYSRISHVGCL